MITIWLLVIIFLTIIEMITVNLTTIWFIISAIVSLILAYLNIIPHIQFIIFVVLGVLLLIITKPFLDKFIKSEPTNLDRIIGMKGIVTSEINENTIGEVKVDGKLWSAYADKKIGKDTSVKVLKIKGNKIKVEDI